MAGSQKWEVVGGKNVKKAKGPMSKKEQQAFLDSMPKVDVLVPLDESSTIYDAFVNKKKPERNGKNSSPKPSNSPSARKQAQQQNKQKQQKPVEKKEKPSNLDDAIQKIDASELETVLMKDKATFPDNPNIWIKDVASMLNLQLDRVAEGDPVFSGKPLGYPANIVKTNARKILNTAINHCSKKILDLFFDHCVNSMINDMGKGISTYGYRIFIQIIARDRPETVLSNLKQYVDLMKSNQDRPLRCLSIMWAIAQAGQTKLGNGLKVWLEAFLPVMNVRALSVFVVDYLDTLFKYHRDLKSASNALAIRDFFPILDIAFALNPSLPSHLQKRLNNLYPKLKEIAFGSKPNENLRNFFPSFLVRLTPKVHKSLRNELLNSLVHCLSTDKQCFSVWRQMYTKELMNSGILLEHLAAKWKGVGQKLERNLLQETIRAFSITNEELATQGQKDTQKDGYKKCMSACKELLTKMSSPRFPWRTIFFLIFLSIAGLVSYDVYNSGGFKKSKTSKLLNDAGVLVFLEQGWHRVTIYSNKALVWLKANVPVYYAKTCEFLGPYLTLFWEKLYELGVYLAEVSKPVREYLNEKIPQLLEWIQVRLPWLTSTVGHYLGIAWAFTLHYSLLVWHSIVHYSHIAGTWLQENVFTGKLSGENIQKGLSSSLAVVQSYTSFAVQWVAQLFNSSTK